MDRELEVADCTSLPQDLARGAGRGDKVVPASRSGAQSGETLRRASREDAVDEDVVRDTSKRIFHVGHSEPETARSREEREKEGASGVRRRRLDNSDCIEAFFFFASSQREKKRGLLSGDGSGRARKMSGNRFEPNNNRYGYDKGG